MPDLFDEIEYEPPSTPSVQAERPRDIFDTIEYEPDREYDLWGGVKDTAHGIFDAVVYGLPEQAARISEETMDENPMSQRDWKDRFIARKEAHDLKHKKNQGREKFVLPPIPGVLPEGITRGNVQDSMESLPFSATGMAGGIAGRVAGLATPVPGGAAAGSILGSAAALTPVALNHIKRELLSDLERSLDRRPTEKEASALLKDYEKAINKHATGEVLPEAIGNAIEIGLLSKIIGKTPAGKSFLKSLSSRALAATQSLFTELTTETITQQIQQPAEVEMGLRPGERPREPFNLRDIYTSYKEVAPQVVPLQAVMGLGAGAVGVARGRQAPEQAAEPVTPPNTEEVLATIEDDLHSGRIYPEQLRALAPQLEEVGVTREDVEGIIAGYEIAIAPKEKKYTSLSEIGKDVKTVQTFVRAQDTRIRKAEAELYISDEEAADFEREARLEQYQPEAPGKEQFDLVKKFEQDAIALQQREDKRRAAKKGLLPAPEGKIYGEGFVATEPPPTTKIRRPKPVTKKPQFIRARVYKTEKGARLAFNEFKKSGKVGEGYDVFPVDGGFQIRTGSEGIVQEKKVADAAAKEQEEVVRANPIYVAVEEARRNPINLDAFKQDYDSATTGQILAKFPGVLSKTGKSMPDEFAEEQGFENLDQLVETLKSAKSMKDLRETLAVAPDLAEVDELVKKGYEPRIDSSGRPEKMTAAELNKGDKIIGRVNDVADEYEVMSTSGGQVTLKDGTTEKVDLFDTIDVEGIKKKEFDPLALLQAGDEKAMAAALGVSVEQMYRNQLENAKEDQEEVVPQRNALKKQIGDLEKQNKAQEEVIKDWSSRKYKEIKTQYEKKDEFGQYAGVSTFGSANERRRRRTIQLARDTISENNKIFESLSQKLEPLEEEYQDAQKRIDEANKKLIGAEDAEAIRGDKRVIDKEREVREVGERDRGEDVYKPVEEQKPGRKKPAPPEGREARAAIKKGDTITIDGNKVEYRGETAIVPDQPPAHSFFVKIGTDQVEADFTTKTLKPTDVKAGLDDVLKRFGKVEEEIPGLFDKEIFDIVYQGGAKGEETGFYTAAPGKAKIFAENAKKRGLEPEIRAYRVSEMPDDLFFDLEDSDILLNRKDFVEKHGREFGDSAKRTKPFAIKSLISEKEILPTPPPKPAKKAKAKAKEEVETKLSRAALPYTELKEGRIEIIDFDAVPWAKVNKYMKGKGYDYRGAKDARELYERQIDRSEKAVYGKDQAEAVRVALGKKPEVKAKKDVKPVITKAVKEFGITTDPKEAGYLLPDGRMLDFSGKREGGSPGVRAMDHREIHRSYDPEGSGFSAALVEFSSNTGAIRMDYKPGLLSVDFYSHPTKKQISKIKKLIDGDTDLVADVQSDQGYLIDSIEVSGHKGKLAIEKLIRNNYEKVSSTSLFAKGEAPSKPVTDQQALADIATQFYSDLREVLPASVMNRITVDFAPILKETDFRGVAKSAREHAERGKIGAVLAATTLRDMRASITMAYAVGQHKAPEGRQRTAFHEAFHVASAWLLPKSDYNLVLNAYKKNEEAAADGFAEYAATRKTDRPAGIKRIFEKLRRIYEAIRSGLQGEGFGTAEAVFDKLLAREYKDIGAAAEEQTLFAKAPDPKADEFMAKLKRIYAGKGPKISPKKAARLIDRYEGLIATLKSDRKDIYAKQKALEKHIKEKLPPQERSQVLHTIKSIAAVQGAEARQRRLDVAIARVEKVHQKVAKKQALQKVDKLLKKKLPKKDKRGVLRTKQMTAEANRRMTYIRMAIKMSQDDVVAKQLELFEQLDKDNREPTSKELERIALFQAFTELEGKTLSQIQQAGEILQQVIDEGRSQWMVQEEERKARMTGLRDTAEKEFSGGKGEKTDRQIKQEKARAGLWTNIAKNLRSFDDMHQSWEFLLDKLSRYDVESGTLTGKTTEYFSSMVHAATHQEHAGTAEQQKFLYAKLFEIYGSRMKVAKTINRNSEIKEKTGVYRYNEDKKAEMLLSQNEAYKLWQMFQQPTLIEEMESQGYTADTLAQLEKYLTPEVKEWAQWQLDEFYPQYREGINDVFKTLFYVDMANIEQYSPISRQYEGQKIDDPLLGAGGHYSSVLPGSVKSRVKNSRGFNIMDGDAVLLKHIVEMEHFKAWGIPMREMRSVLGAENIQRILEQYHGRTAKNVLKKFIDDFASGGVDRAVTLNFLDKMRSNFTKSVIGANPVVFVKQLMSMPAYTMAMPVHSWTVGMASLSNPAEVRRAWRTLMKSKAMQERYKIGHERDIMLALRRSAPKQLAGKRTLSDLIMLSTKLGDKAAIVLGGWPMYKYEYKQALKAGKTEKEANKIALTAFERATERAQQAGNIKDMAHVQRLGSLGKLFTMFMTAPASYYRNAAAGARNLAAGRGSKTENMKRVIMAWAVLPMLFQWAASGFEWDDEKMARALLVGPLNGLFIAREIIDGVMSALMEGKIYWSMGVTPPLSFAQKLGYAAANINKMVTEGFEQERFEKTIKQLVEVAGNLSGIPVGPVSRVAEGIKAAVEDETGKPIRRALGYSEKALEND